MNRDQVKGGVKDTAGKIQKRFGQMLGSDRQEAQGVETQAEGKTQQTVGDVKDAVRKTTDNLKNSLKR